MAQRGSVRTREVLSHELGHRLRNVFSLVLTIIRQTGANYPEASEYRHALEPRLRALAVAATLADRTDPLSVGEIIRLELAPFKEGNNILISGPDVRLKRDVQDFAILVHELTTNAVKHGALSSPNGKLSVTWCLSRAVDGQPSFVLEWIECDGPQVGAIRSPGFGTMVIAESGSLLGGTASVEYGRGGLQYRLNLPVDRVQTGAP